METGRRATEEESRALFSHALNVMGIQGELSPEQVSHLFTAFEDLRRADPAPPEKPGGRARKISVSMPEDLSAAVRRRVGHGEFSRYVTEAVAGRLKEDLLAELIELLDAEHGEVPEDLVEKAESLWPDAE